MTDDALAQLVRWRDSGGTWRVLARSDTGAVVALLTCTGGEEQGRLTSADPRLLGFLDDNPGESTDRR